VTAVLIVIILICAFFIALYAVYSIAFKGGRESDMLLNGTLDKPGYKPYAEEIRNGAQFAKTTPCERVTITARDGTPLVGRIYHQENHRGVILLFHGYRSLACNDFSCALGSYMNDGFSLLLVDERAHGESGGRALSFGILERYDCLDWIAFVEKRFPGDKLVLDGISMGAATVMMASEFPLPDSVCGIIADSGYTSPKEIITKVMTVDAKLPKACYPLVKLAAKVFGGFDLEESSALEAVKSCKKPILIVHGEADGFVPCEMSARCFEACNAPYKRLVTVPGADHGMSFLVDKPRVKKAIHEFFDAIGV